MKNYDSFFKAIDHRDAEALETVLVQNRGDIPPYALAVGLSRAIDTNQPAAVKILIDTGASTRSIESFVLNRVIMEERKEIYALLREKGVTFIPPLGGEQAARFRQAQRFLDGEVARDKMALEIAALKAEILTLKSADTAAVPATEAAFMAAKAQIPRL